VAAGSSVGALARWGVGAAVGAWLGAAFLPLGTLFINVSGSLFLGWFAAVLSERLPADGWIRPDDLRLLLAVGFAGGYTTFSTYAWEADSLLAKSDGFTGTLYLLGSVLLGLAAVRCGTLLARRR
jgi:CrcB protein